MNNYRNKQPGFIETIVTTFSKGLWFVISWPFKKLFRIKSKGVSFNKIENFAKWREIEKLLESKDEIHAKHAVVEADKFFDSILRIKGGKGESFADRLRSLENHFSHDNYQFIWQAHKLRNQISHESEFHPQINYCKQALNKFRKGLENLGAI